MLCIYQAPMWLRIMYQYGFMLCIPQLTMCIRHQYGLMLKQAYYDYVAKWLKGGSHRLTEPAEMWSMMVNTSSRVMKCTRKALMTL